MFHCTRAARAAVTLALLATVAANSPAAAQPATQSNFTIYVRSVPVGTEQVSVEQTPEGWTIASSGRTAEPAELVLRQLTARYTTDWKPIDLTVDATVRGQITQLHTVISGTTASTEFSAGAFSEVVRQTETVDAQSLFLPNPFIAPYEALAARVVSATPGTTLFLYQPGQGSFTAIVGESATERLQTISRLITARRTTVTFQAGGQPPIATEIWAEDSGRLLRFHIPAQGLEVARDDMAAVSTRRMTMARPNDTEVRIHANGFSLAGTLSKPEGASGPLPAIILVSGSGEADRDGTTAGIPLFGQLADSLANAGFAVLRYDRRGVGQSGGRPESATLGDYAEDLRAAIRTMSDRKDVDKRRIVLVGHGEGGALALMAASKEKRVAAVALLATTGTSGAEANLYEVTHALERANRPEAERQSTLDLQRRIQEAVITGKGWEGIAVSDAVRRQAETPYFQSFLTYDPAKVMKDVEQPILIVHGTLDTQVPPSSADRLESLAHGRKKSSPVAVVKLPGLNHLLVPATTGEVDEYAQLGDAAVSADVTRAIADWLAKTLVPSR